mmetsp:Transcript_35223/g.115987  ORF Transcript_35223/g.115987 Transcript_35223/m.115987 type:complete len:281 (-) Transcript_35223:1256-2098(-)
MTTWRATRAPSTTRPSPTTRTPSSIGCATGTATMSTAPTGARSPCGCGEVSLSHFCGRHSRASSQSRPPSRSASPPSAQTESSRTRPPTAASAPLCSRCEASLGRCACTAGTRSAATGAASAPPRPSRRISPRRSTSRARPTRCSRSSRRSDGTPPPSAAWGPSERGARSSYSTASTRTSPRAASTASRWTRSRGSARSGAGSGEGLESCRATSALWRRRWASTFAATGASTACATRAKTCTTTARPRSSARQTTFTRTSRRPSPCTWRTCRTTRSSSAR